MNAERRIVPSHHVTSVLAEDHISERTIGMKYILEQSDKKLDKIANKWTAHDGINSLSRVMLRNVGQVPIKISPIKIIHHETPKDKDSREIHIHEFHDHNHNAHN